MFNLLVVCVLVVEGVGIMLVLCIMVELFVSVGVVIWLVVEELDMCCVIIFFYFGKWLVLVEIFVVDLWDELRCC